MDVDRMSSQAASKVNNKQEEIAFQQATGARMSAMEHLVPEQMFSTEDSQAQGVSAVKAIAIASQEGQKIWTIDQNNLNLALSSINLGADTERDIRNAVHAGKTVTTHEAQINFNGWIGEGYIILDPNTGAGAYMIAGGGNGGELIPGTNQQCGVVCDVLNTLFSVVSILANVAGTVEEYLHKIDNTLPKFFQNAARFLGYAGILMNIVDAISSCSGVEILIVLVPIRLFAILLPLMLGPTGFALVGFLPMIINIIGGFIAAAGMNALKGRMCK